jgi:hypothetical protein
MFRAGLIAVLAILLIAGAPIPLPKPTNQGHPQTAADNKDHNQPRAENQPQTSKLDAQPVAGANEKTPLYVRTSCEHGCGYSEDDKGLWEKIITDPNALFALAVAMFTGGLLVMGVWTNCLIIKQIKLGRDEFTASHPPILRVRRIWPVGKSTFLGNAATEVRIIVANIGQSEAKIVRLSSNVISERDRTKREEFQADSATSDYSGGHIVVPPGKQGIINVFSTLAITPETYWGTRGAAYEAMAIGVIEYEDRMGSGYSVGFARMYDPTSNRFRVVAADDPESDREYEN